MVLLEEKLFQLTSRDELASIVEPERTDYHHREEEEEPT
jgi:hypothetical protein